MALSLNAGVIQSTNVSNTYVGSNSRPQTQNPSQNEPFAEPEGPLSKTDSEIAQHLVQKVSTAEWLGPMASIALSPYFGIMCLSGLAQFGSGTALQANGFVSGNPILKNPLVFWIFLGLTIATSLPRFTKVSKPIAQFLDRVETYSAIITLVVIRMAVSSSPPEASDASTVVSAGFLSFGYDSLMIVAAALNVFIIATVRFVIELLIWMSPLPTVDAIFELANKSFSGSLMAIYSFSPLTAMVINILLFAGCLAVFFPVRRRAIYLRSLIVDPVVTLMFPKMGTLRNGEMIVFNRNRLGSFPAKTRLFLSKSDSGWILRRPNWLIGATEIELSKDVAPMIVETGLLLSRIKIANLDNAQLIFSRRYLGCIQDHCHTLGLVREKVTRTEIEFNPT